MNLTENMKKALMQVGYGATYRRRPGSFKAAFFDANDKIVDRRSLDALSRRGLVWGFTTGGAPCVSAVRLTDKGDELFEKLREEEMRKRWGRR